MNNRSWLWLLLSACLSLAPSDATAQTLRVDFGSALGVQYPGDKASHRELPGGLDMNAGQAMMAERLHELHELHQLQDQIQGLLKDPDFKNTLRDKFSDDELRRLREKILHGDKLGRDNDWNKLLQQAVSRNKLDERQMEILRRWAERADNKQANASTEPNLLPGPPRPAEEAAGSSSPSSGSTSSLAPASFAEPSMRERLSEKISDWIGKNMDGLGGDLVGALAELGINDEGGPLADILRSVKEPDFLGEGFLEEAAGLSSYLPDVSELIHEQRGAWDDMRSLFRGTHAPSLPGLGGNPSLPSLPGTSTADGDWSAGSFALLGLGVLVLLVGKMAVGARAKTTPDRADEWRLGSWPVQPAAVSTRQELIRAFEYLALLCLGPAAITWHHRELASRLAEQERGDPARRRHAAELLAWLYEQARYAPSSASLSPEELSEARHALCFLAGVTIV
jgi:hypothetical protein